LATFIKFETSNSLFVLSVMRYGVGFRNRN